MSDNYAALTQSGSSVSTLLSEIGAYKYNPSGIQRTILNHLSKVINGEIEIVDPTNPFVFLLEASSINTAAAIIDNEASTRKLYPSVAQTVEDLYLHMSDKDYVNRFALPSKTKFSILINKAELLGAMVLDTLTGIKKIRIPKNTEFKVADTVFSLQYPVDIKQLQHGGLQVVYDATDVSPLQTLSTNLVNWEIRSPVGLNEEWLWLEVDVQQFQITSITNGITSATGYSQDISLTDSFYYARVYYQTNSGPWTEIQTTHTDQVYDYLKPTAVLKVLDSKLNVSIPQVYLNTNLLTGTLRVDVYQTKGELNMILSNYTQQAFSANWLTIDASQKDQYTEVIGTIKGLIVYSTSLVNGGKSAMTFEKLREQVIKNAIGDTQIPITNVKIASALELEGYTIVKNVDVITNRAYLATRALPKPFDEKLITAGSTSIETFISSINDLVSHPEVYNNDGRVTITPDLLYQNINGVITPVAYSDKVSLLGNTPDKLAIKVSAGNYLYTPFHYVLDTTMNEFDVRPYYFDKPVPVSITFIEQNDKTGYQVNTSQYTIDRTDTGYKLTIVTVSNDAYKAIADNELKVFLAFTPKGEKDKAYIAGNFVSVTSGGERIFEFDIRTNFDVDSNDYLQHLSFLMYNLDSKVLGSDLTDSFDILYVTNASVPTGWSPGVLDSYTPDFLVNANTVGITHESIKLLFGYSLKTLWSRSRTIVDSAPYRKHTQDIPLLYEEDVYKLDPVTGSKFSINSAGEVVYDVLHRRGDQVLDLNGLPVYKFRAGDIVRDSLGNPIIDSVNLLVRQIDMMFIEGIYRFANDSAASSYRTNITDTLITWLVNDLDSLSTELLEQTKIYFYPKTTMGLIEVMIKDGLKVIIDAAQSFVVNLYVSDAVSQNTVLRNSITSTTIKTIDTMLDNVQVSMSNIISALKDNYGSDVISVNVTGLGGSLGLDALTILQDGERCSIRKKLVPLADGSLIVSEDVSVNFIRHSL